MQIHFQKIEIQPTEHTIATKKQSAIILQGTCALGSWKAVYHFTADGEIASQYPLFGCKNYDKTRFHRCVPLSTEYQNSPCPIITQQVGEIKLKAIEYLLAHNFIDTASLSPKADPLIRRLASMSR